MWSRTIPTENCDVLVTFPSALEDDVLMWVLARLRARVPELSVHVRHHIGTGIYGFYLTASFEEYVIYCCTLSDIFDIKNIRHISSKIMNPIYFY